MTRVVDEAVLDARITRTRRDVLAAVIDELVDNGWEGATHARIATRAGYAKATIYVHWPDRLALVRDALAQFGDMSHFAPTGDLRTDLIGELTSFRTAMTDHRLDRVLAVLAERSAPVPALVAMRDSFVDDGERPLRRALARHLRGVRLEAATTMLCGAIVHPILLRGHVPSDREIAAAVDIVLGGVEVSVAGS